MPARLVYAPKAYVYTKDQAGVTYNISNYVTAGNVQRKLNQVSSATITLRNPYKMFTGGQGRKRVFHPMDPITIYLERVRGYPVQVFTGYLDNTPYYQMYPGTVTLQASCTLKRLLYTFFDPSLPYVIAFFTKYGWINTGTGSIISSSAFGNNGTNQAAVNSGDKPFTDLQDGSLAKLLWAVLYDIGEWKDSNIYVENLPTGANGIASRMAALMKSIQHDQEQAASDFTQFLNAVVGGGIGSGGGAGATGVPGTLKGNTNAEKVYNYFTQQGLTGAQAAGIIGNWMQESGVNPSEHGGYIAQWGGARLDALNAFAAKAGKPVTDLGVQCAFAWSELNGPYASTLAHLRRATTPGQAATVICNEYEMPASWAANLQGRIQYANDAYAAYSKPGNVAGQAGVTITSIGNQVAGQIGTSNTSSSTPGGGTTTPVFPMLKGTFVPEGSWTPDDGVDIASFGCGKQVPLLAIGSGTVTAHGIGGFGPWAPTLKLDTPIEGYHYVYYGHAGPDGLAAIDTHLSAGQQIASVGCGIVGLSTGPHLEIGFAKDGSGNPVGSGSAQTMMNVLKSATKQQSVSTGSSSSGATGDVNSQQTAQAFVAELQFPSVEDQITAIALGAEHKGLMHDQNLLPFVQQLTQASLRSFQSLPNGDFYAFYPDYFGEMGHHKPYWLIHDIEILEGGINLSDDSLATHVFAVGDNTWPVNQELLNMLFSAGSINIFNAFVTTGILDTTKLSSKDKTREDGLQPHVMNAEEAIQFIKRYGARPLVQNYPMVRSPIFEMLLAYQQFMYAWSNQFKTPFTFTFMPELYPGGKVGFPEHGLQMYINSVTHDWNYEEGGFTTTADLTAPSILDGVNPADFPDLPPLMVQALVEPVRNTASSTAQQAAQAAQQAKDFVGNALNGFANLLNGM